MQRSFILGLDHACSVLENLSIHATLALRSAVLVDVMRRRLFQGSDDGLLNESAILAHEISRIPGVAGKLLRLLTGTVVTFEFSARDKGLMRSTNTCIGVAISGHLNVNSLNRTYIPCVGVTVV